tara:strand:+ start:318 stop:833 length:516 start_codon:yes stop_codon:yes gene_type:complete
MPRVGNKHYPYTPEGRAAAARDKQGRGLTATEGFNQPGQLDDAAGRAMYAGGGKISKWLRKKMKDPEFVARAQSDPKFIKMLKETPSKAHKPKKAKELHQAVGLKKGGKVKKQGYDSRLDESLGVRHGKKKEQKYKDRRDESRAMAKKGRSKASKRGDGVARQGHTKGRLV